MQDQTFYGTDREIPDYDQKANLNVNGCSLKSYICEDRRIAAICVRGPYC